MMKDRYLQFSEQLNRLVGECRKYGSLFIAFDFDNTVFDYHNVGDTFPKVESLLRSVKERGHTLILFTGNEGDRLTEIVQYCTDHGYTPDFINENPVMATRKPYYNVLLDDRAGLDSTYELVSQMLDITYIDTVDHA